MCENGLPGIDGPNSAGDTVYCPAKCGQCGGSGCGSGSAGLHDYTNVEWCVNGVINNQGNCADTGEATCSITEGQFYPRRLVSSVEYQECPMSMEGRMQLPTLVCRTSAYIRIYVPTDSFMKTKVVRVGYSFTLSTTFPPTPFKWMRGCRTPLTVHCGLPLPAHYSLMGGIKKHPVPESK